MTIELVGIVGCELWRKDRYQQYGQNKSQPERSKRIAAKAAARLLGKLT
jgi:hypothetical protein